MGRHLRIFTIALIVLLIFTGCNGEGTNPITGSDADTESVVKEAMTTKADITKMTADELIQCFSENGLSVG